MKRMILPLLAAATLVTTGCSNDETVEVPQGHEIGFETPFINKTGRAYTLEQNTFKRFLLWGTSTFANDYIFDGDAVAVDGNVVTYNPKRFWNEGATYHFMALATPVDATNDEAWTFTPPETIPTVDGYFGKLDFDNTATGANGIVDFCYAGADRTTASTLTANDTKQVTLAFKHALSRIRLRFVNEVGENYYIEVKNIMVKGLPEKGVLDFGTTPLAWVNTGYGFNKELFMTPSNPPAATSATGEELINQSATTETMYTLPDDEKFTVEFDVNLWVKVGEDYTCLNGADNAYHHKAEVSVVQTITSEGSTVEVPGLLMGTGYVFQCSINQGNISPDGLKPIEFTVSVEGMNYNGMMDIEGKVITASE